MKKIKLISLIMVSIMLFTLFSSCAKTIDDSNESSSNYSDSSSLDSGNNNNYNPNMNNQSNQNSTSNGGNQGSQSNPSQSNSLTVFANGATRLKVVYSASGGSFAKTMATSIANLIRSATGKAPTVTADSTISTDSAILVGSTKYQESQALMKTLGAQQAKAQISGNKYVIVYSSEYAATSLFEKLKGLFGKQASSGSLVIDSAWTLKVNSTSIPTVNVPNKVMAVCQKTQKAVFYDLDKYTSGKTLEDLEITSFSIGHAAGIKYREGTVFGNVVLIAASQSSGTAGIYSYPSGKSLWTTSSPGSNPHSIEMLPSGNLIIASSSDHKLRFFKTSALKNGGSVSYVDYTLEDAHGVLWDPKYSVLWAIGNVDLKAYRIQGSGTGEKLVEDTSLSIKLPENFRGGHDLSPDYTNTRYLYLSLGYRLVKFDKETKQMLTLTTKSPDSVKGFSNNPNGNIFASGKCGGTGTSWDNAHYNSWCTDTINFCKLKGDGTYEKIAIKTTTRAFYKTRAFCGSYQ